MGKISFNFNDRTAIVTGGAQGFGLDITKRLLNSGAKVIIWDNDPKMTKKAISDLNNSSLSSNLKSIGSKLNLNNLLTGINTYQLYTLNKNTKSLRS